MLTLATTSLGTPRAASWDDAWLALVEATELRLGRAICGAHAPDGEPCELGSTHPNGRCRFHGGHPRIGAQPGNTNALVHGLYSRRLRQCNDTCPLWQSCPFAGADVMELSERKRPVCAYEREAFNLAMRIPAFDLEPGDVSSRTGTSAPLNSGPTDDAAVAPQNALDYMYRSGIVGNRDNLLNALKSRGTPFFGQRGADTKFPRPLENPSDESDRTIHPDEPTPTDIDPAKAIIEDTGAILFAMLQRATLTVSAEQRLTETTEAEGPRYSMRSTKMSAALGAFLRIGRELRAWLRLRQPTPTQAAPAIPSDASDTSNWSDASDRPQFTKEGYIQFYDYKGEKVGLPSLMHPFIDELDAVVEQLRQEGVNIPPPLFKPLATD